MECQELQLSRLQSKTVKMEESQVQYWRQTEMDRLQQQQQRAKVKIP